MISLSTEASAAAAALGLGMLLGCGESSAESGSEAPAPTTGSSGFGGGFSMDDIGGIGNSACLTEIRVREHLPLDLYIMFDLSCSMNGDPSAAGHHARARPGDTRGGQHAGWGSNRYCARMRNERPPSGGTWVAPSHDEPRNSES